jgi:multicomponent Na+:H+ antiporter subunit D
VLQFTSTGVVDCAGIKVPFFIFLGHDYSVRDKEPPLNMLLAIGISAFFCVGLDVYFQSLYNMLPFLVHYEPYTGAHMVTQLQLFLFGPLAFTLLIFSGYYVPEVRSKNLDADWTYRKLGRFLYSILDKGLKPLNKVSEEVLMGIVKGSASFFKNAVAKIVLFVTVDVWLVLGYSDKRLEIKKMRFYNDIAQGILSIGIGATVAIFFILLVFVLT